MLTRFLLYGFFLRVMQSQNSLRGIKAAHLDLLTELCSFLRCPPVSTRVYRASNPIPPLPGMAIHRANPQDGQGGNCYEKVVGSISPGLEFNLFGVRAKHRTANER